MYKLAEKAENLFLSNDEGDRGADTFRTLFLFAEDGVDTLQSVYDLDLDIMRRHVNYAAYDGEADYVYFSSDFEPGRAIWRMTPGTAERYIHMPPKAMTSNSSPQRRA